MPNTDEQCVCSCETEMPPGLSTFRSTNIWLFVTMPPVPLKSVWRRGPLQVAGGDPMSLKMNGSEKGPTPAAFLARTDQVCVPTVEL